MEENDPVAHADTMLGTALRYGPMIDRHCVECGHGFTQFRRRGGPRTRCDECRASPSRVIHREKGKPTERQQELLKAIQNYRRRHRCAPTWIELGELLGVHFSVVQKTLVRMRARGWVAWERGKNRSLRVMSVRPHDIR